MKVKRIPILHRKLKGCWVGDFDIKDLSKLLDWEWVIKVE